MLRDLEGAAVGVSIVGYEFELADSPDDDTANWLEIRLEITNVIGAGWCQAACLTTTEVHYLYHWLRLLARTEPLGPEPGTFMVFREPNVAFHFEGQTAELVTLDVTYNLEQPGEWTRSDQPENHHTWSGRMWLRVPREELLRASDDLEAQSQLFPYRHVNSRH